MDFNNSGDRQVRRQRWKLSNLTTTAIATNGFDNNQRRQQQPSEATATDNNEGHLGVEGEGEDRGKCFLFLSYFFFCSPSNSWSFLGYWFWQQRQWWFQQRQKVATTKKMKAAPSFSSSTPYFILLLTLDPFQEIHVRNGTGLVWHRRWW